MEKALQGRQKYLKESIFRPLQGSVKTTPYPQGSRPGLEICRPLRGCVERLNGVLQQSQFFAPTFGGGGGKSPRSIIEKIPSHAAIGSCTLRRRSLWQNDSFYIFGDARS